jgi:hypothetical protein
MEDYRAYIHKTANQRLVGSVLLVVAIVGMFIFGATIDKTASYSQNSNVVVNFQD